MTLALAFHGAAGTVTGSCMELVGSGGRILVDCGMFQGSRTLEALNFRPLPFAPGKIDAVVLTHAHIDHSGLLPRLVSHGFDGPIWCTRATADLLEFMLADAGRIQESDARRRNRRPDRADSVPFEPIYTEAEAISAWRRARPVELEEWFAPTAGFRARLWNAGHILGSASVEIEADGVRLLCSGDLGPQNKSFHPHPQASAGFDHLVCESTYGDRTREKLDAASRREHLASEITRALAKGGNLVIPAFALERTQELLADIAKLASSGRLGNATVFVDSPLASEVTRVFASHASELEGMSRGDPFSHPAIHYIADTDASIRLNSVSGAIILAASGMCEGGRIRHHLIHNLPRADSTILFVGYQAQGTLGSVLSEGASRVRISGRDVAVRADVRSLEGYSAHADQSELLAWIAARVPITGSLFLDHGEKGALAELARLAAPATGAKVIIPEIGEQYELRPGTPAKRTRTGLPDLGQALRRDWQNDYAELAANLKQRLQALPDDEARRMAVQQIKRLLDEQAHSSQSRGRSYADRPA